MCVYIGVSNLLTREVVEWMGMGYYYASYRNEQIYTLNQHVDVIA